MATRNLDTLIRFYTEGILTEEAFHNYLLDMISEDNVDELLSAVPYGYLRGFAVWILAKSPERPIYIIPDGDIEAVKRSLTAAHGWVTRHQKDLMDSGMGAGAGEYGPSGPG